MSACSCSLESSSHPHLSSSQHSKLTTDLTHSCSSTSGWNEGRRGGGGHAPTDGLTRRLRLVHGLRLNRLRSRLAPPTSCRRPRPTPHGVNDRVTFRLPLGVPAVSAQPELHLEGASASHGKMKRSHNYSSSDSDLDDNVEVEKDSGDENGQLDSHGSMSPSTTTQVQARKRRRGIIEKRRRDRINNSLSELRRLVPSAFEKQGSAKLEKAEILQMTVDHLKMLHASGGKGYFEAQALAKDYHSLGFRECLAETARYLSIIEGRDSADPLRVRLVSHLSNYASQREVHTGLEHLAWGSAYGAAPAHLPHPLLLNHPQGRTPASKGSPLSSSSSSTSPSSTTEASGISRLSALPPNSSLPLSLPVPTSKVSPPLVSSISAFPLSFGAFPLIAPMALSTARPSSNPSKPYRPWGTEIGAF